MVRLDLKKKIVTIGITVIVGIALFAQFGDGWFRSESVWASPDAAPSMSAETRNYAVEAMWEYVGTRAKDVANLRPYIDASTAKHGWNPAVVTALVWHESGGDMTAKGEAGEVCAAQVIPKKEALALGWPSWFTRPSASELMDPAYCIEWATDYLYSKYEAAGGDLWDAYRMYNGVGAGARNYANKVTDLYNDLVEVAIQASPEAQQLQHTSVQLRRRFTTTPYDPMPSIAQDFWEPAEYMACGHHSGIDFGRGFEATVRAVEAGRVVAVFPMYGECRFRGCNVVIINHGRFPDGDHLYTIYSHGSKAYVQPGQWVEAGVPVIAESNRGYGRVSHVHFEVYKGLFTGDKHAPFGYGPTTCAPGWLDPKDFLPGY